MTLAEELYALHKEVSGNMVGNDDFIESINEALERAALECEKEYMTGTTGTAAMAAMRIRALKDKP